MLDASSSNAHPREHFSKPSTSCQWARTPRGRIRAAVEHHIQWGISNQAATRFLLAHREPEVRRLSDPAVAEMNSALEALLREWLDEQAAAGKQRRISPDIYIALVIGPAQSYVRRWLTGSTTTPSEEAIEILSAAAWRSVQIEPSRQRAAARRRPRGGQEH